ncbi:hypothetical protein ERD78_18805 [Allopusillimonas soli]|uniref:Uncharacterized protein n=1 Tax=Allopusillimonas soli TaxID=659016 RepID=A0A853FGW5_9BURK|nr:hypothetical protein [Allopusillimonas soli]NYT38882.1 hypothetical protein [Allopusillimonas soli]TEA70119.1 hypothetical protein ERD78_18805 [Allopusillimonas soli]
MFKFKSTLQEGPKYLRRTERQIPFATSRALNSTAKQVKSALDQAILRDFDRPTPYTQRALRINYATKAKLQAYVGFRDSAGKGVSANQYLWAQVHGGTRRAKRSEQALAKVGLPGGYVVPGAGAQLDAYGNMSRGQLVKLLSYLQAFGEQGYRANATRDSIARTAKLSGPKLRGRKKSQYVKINGVAYFISRGKGTMSGNWSQPLAAGVWQKSGTHGVDVKPVLLATKAAPHYTKRLPFYETADQVFGEHYDTEFANALEHALKTAR